MFDIYAALGTGATSVGAPLSVLHDPAALTALLREQRVSVADIPPAVLGLLDPAGLPDLRALFVGLEAFPAELVNRWRTPIGSSTTATGRPRRRWPAWTTPARPSR